VPEAGGRRRPGQARPAEDSRVPPAGAPGEPDRGLEFHRPAACCHPRAVLWQFGGVPVSTGNRRSGSCAPSHPARKTGKRYNCQHQLGSRGLIEPRRSALGLDPRPGAERHFKRIWGSGRPGAGPRQPRRAGRRDGRLLPRRQTARLKKKATRVEAFVTRFSDVGSTPTASTNPLTRQTVPPIHETAEAMGYRQPIPGPRSRRFLAPDLRNLQLAASCGDHLPGISRSLPPQPSPVGLRALLRAWS
jgi:hypothetical protein